MEKRDLHRKLRALSAMVDDPNGNEHEQANAYKIMQKLLLQYRIELSAIRDEEEEIQSREMLHGTRIFQWKKILLGSLAQAMDCQILICRKWDAKEQYNVHYIEVLGHESDLEIAVYLYESLYGKLKKASLASYKNSYTAVSQGQYVTNYIASAAYRICDRIDEAKKTVYSESDCTDLVVSRSAIVHDFIDRSKENIGKAKAPKLSSEGIAEGYREGNRVALTKGLKVDPESEILQLELT